MAGRVFWRIPQQILCIELEGDITIEDFHHINQAVNELLGPETRDAKFVVLVDITQPCRVPTGFAQLKASQTYSMRHDIRFIVVVGNNKFMRLMTRLMFSLCIPGLRYCDSFEQVSALASNTLDSQSQV